jgi:probable O-glycosylation ligase (exosortase A-associated)
MKQTIFMVVVMAYFSLRSIVDPFWGVMLYYGLAVLRPQSIWEWSLPSGVRWSFMAAMVAVVTLVLNFSSLKHRVIQRRFIPMILLFGLFLLGSYLFALDRRIAGIVGWEYAKIIIMLVVASYVIRERWHIKYLGWMIFLCLTYLVYEVNSLYMFNHRLDIYHNGYGGLDNNGAALMLAMAVPFCYCFFLAERRWWRWGFFICIIPVMHAVMLTYSRGAMLSTLIAVVGMVIMTARKNLVQTVVVSLVLGALVLSLAGPDVRKRFFSISKGERDASARSRLDSWKAGWAIAKDYPMFGAGIRNANLLTKQYGADLYGRTIHNVYIQIAADSGIPAGLFYLSLVTFSIWRLWCAVHRTGHLLYDREDRWFHYTCLGAMWSLAIFAIGAAFLSFETFELPYLLMLIGAFAPFLSAEHEAKEGTEELESKKTAARISTGGLSA